MPGSLTISHHEASVAMEHIDAKRLATMLEELAYLLEIPGPNRINDAQLAALCEGRAPDRAELVHWSRELATELKGRL
ncbi:hypothetical protein RMN57_18010 [Kitasatospora sp. CM 4170]|uniref:Uncharacterized protein n=1 Tax=Kitasatospora aburaviensis TaxID=67265 RepID=A0ABW1EX29_9ACTN|nr:hypothetical protein [Kitasatospora sp. CM 4170]WNM46462.1 hypothetical protein RMN57_18010 [Kitasatospora sp. CM 4170]